MAATKEQMNVQVTPAVKEGAKLCATARRTSLNAYVESAIQEKIAKDRKALRLDEMGKDLKKVAEKYLPGKVATQAEMLAMAQRVAAEDTDEGFTVEHHAKPSSALKGQSKSRRR
jgi:hypothetical protein